MLVAVGFASATSAAEIIETDQGYQCTLNTDCWCQNFHGAGFLPGKGESLCCTNETIDGFMCIKANYCANCIYD